jgi:hypothetical protein
MSDTTRPQIEILEAKSRKQDARIEALERDLKKLLQCVRPQVGFHSFNAASQI